MAINVVQTIYDSGTVTVTGTKNVSFGANVAAGNTLIVVIACTSITATGVSDVQGNTYNLDVTGSLGSARGYIYRASNIAASFGYNTVSVSFNVSGATGYYRVSLMEVSGLANSSVVDIPHGATANTGTPDTGSATTTNANDLVVAYVATDSASGTTWVSPSGYTVLTNWGSGTGGGNVSTEHVYKILSTVGAVDVSWNIQSVGVDWVAGFVTYKQATSGPILISTTQIGTSHIALSTICKQVGYGRILNHFQSRQIGYSSYNFITKSVGTYRVSNSPFVYGVGKYRVVNTFRTAQRGFYGVDQLRLTTQIGRYGYVSLYTCKQVGSYRVANNSMAGYVVYVGRNQLPDLTASPLASAASLPISVAVAPPSSGSDLLYVLTRLKNAYGLESNNQQPLVLSLSSAGVLTYSPPPVPVSVLSFVSSPGVIRTIGAYPSFSTDVAPATSWNLWINTVIPNPSVDTPTTIVPVSGPIVSINWPGLSPGTYYVILGLFRATDSALSVAGVITVVVYPAPNEPVAVLSGYQL